VAWLAPPDGFTEIQQKRTCLQIPPQSQHSVQSGVKIFLSLNIVNRIFTQSLEKSVNG